MQLHDLASTSFVLLRADASVDEARRALAGRDESHVIVEDPARSVAYLFAVDEARDGLAAATPDARVGDVLGLGARPPTPLLSGRLPADGAPDRLIVREDGILIGFVDRQANPPPVETAAPPAAGTEPRVGAAPPPAAPMPVPRSEPERPEGAAAPPRVTRGLRPERPDSAAKPGEGGAGPTRSLEADFPGRVRLGSVATLSVYLTAEAPTAHGIGVDVEPDDRIDVIVQPRSGFVLDESDDRDTLVVPVAGESRHAQFRLKAVEAGDASIRVRAFRRGEPLGLITLESTVVAAGTEVAPLPTRPRRRAQKLATPSPDLPDLTVFVEEWEAGDGAQYRIRLTAEDPALDLNLHPYGPFTLRLDPAGFFEEFFEEIERLPLDTKAQRGVAERRLAAKGTYLAETLLPDDLREKLWEVRKRISSVIVQSEEPWIPWELCRLIGRERGRAVEGPFLCEAYTMTRWLPGVGFKRPLTLRNLALVVPDDSGLPLAEPERAYVRSLARGRRRVTEVRATYAALQDAFARGVFDAWHFTGHGVARDANPDRSPILLAKGEAFTPESLSGRAANVGLPHPLVFINACQVGRAGMALTGIGGWANRFVEAGAGAFIGAYWSVYDEPAYAFATEVYARLLKGEPIGRAVRDARLAIRRAGDPTWLAYTVFADPLAVVA